MLTSIIKVREARRFGVCVGVFMVGVVAVAGQADAYSSRVKSACRTDYQRFCPSYGVDSPQLKACMRSAGGNISVRCRNALADGGYIPRKYHSSRLGR